jgi:phosphatidylglycerol lysyltransferase
MRDAVRRALPAVVGLVLFIVSLEVLRSELQSVTWQQLSADVLATPRSGLAAALLLTTASYVLLTGYDFLALASVGRHLPPLRVAFTSFLAYAIANNVGLALLSGASVRYRFYTRWGVSARELSGIVASYSATLWLGLLLLGGLSLSVAALPAGLSIGHAAARLAGWLMVIASFAYVVIAFVRRKPIRMRGIELRMPSPTIAATQLALSVADWTIAGAVLFVLLPDRDIPFVPVLGAFLGAQVLGIVSSVPGGLGVFEGLMVLLLKPYVDATELVPALVVYRAVYYLLPLTLALVFLVVDFIHQRREDATRVGVALGRATEILTPRLLAVFTFLCGTVLLFSGATPAAAGRLALLDRILPLGIIETSHFLGSLVGAALLLLSQGLARRLDAAYLLSVFALATGIAASLLKGADYEEAILLSTVLGLLWRAQPAFNRRAALFETRFSLSWILLTAGAIAASVWLGLFAFKHVEYSNQLWWQFELHGEASRFLRATVGIAIAVVLVTLTRWLRHAPHEIETPTDEQLQIASEVIATHSSSAANLVYVRDKTILFDDEKDGFVMYGVQGRTWVALAPVGPLERLGDLIRLFVERCDDFGGIPVFYEVPKEQLFRYADFGLAFIKIGEEGAVELPQLTLDTPRSSRYRQGLRRLEKQGATFRVVPKTEVPCLIPELRRVSDDWLASKAAGEKGFSLGFFDDEYLSRFPVAVIEREGRVVAFANLWPAPNKYEVSLDLMRYAHDAPRDVMEALFVHVILWARDQGYERFCLGMAPLSGFEQSPVAPLWNRLGGFLYQHGESLYNFQGLRAYKQKFDPVWEPRYLVYPGGLKLPRILADVAALIAGGYRKILIK